MNNMLEKVRRAVFLTHALWQQLRDIEKMAGRDLDGLQDFVAELAAGCDHCDDIDDRTISLGISNLSRGAVL